MHGELRVPAREERYQLIELLGRGGVAEAWRALRHTALYDDEVCLKRPLRVLSTAARRSLLEEARLLGRLRHPGVVSLLDVVEDGEGQLALVLELVRGADLRAVAAVLCERGTLLPASAVAAIGATLCRALGAAQRALPAGVVHRDISPHNVLVSLEGEIKLADFGVARALDRERWTASGVLKGKPAYVAPEVLAGDAIDVRTDLFAVGVLLFELLTGTRPFQGEDQGEMLRAIAAGRRRALGAERCLPRSLTRAVEALLSHSPSERPGSADQAAHELGALADAERARACLASAVPEAMKRRAARAMPVLAPGTLLCSRGA